MEPKLEVIRKQPNPDLVQALETLLEDAKAGEIKGIAYSLVFDDEDTGSGWVINGGRRLAHMVGELHMLMTKLSNNRDAEDED